MELESLIQHFFGTDDPGALTQAEFDLAIERLRIGFGVEREPGRKFALWTLLDAFGSAPLPVEAFPKDPQLKAAAEDYLKAAYRMERFGDEDG
ncbi:MAG: hypothetical protein ACKOPG_09285 [Novosphingobium sp.]